MAPKKTPAKSTLAGALEEAEATLQEESTELTTTPDDITNSEPRSSRIPVRKAGSKAKSSTSVSSKIKKSKTHEREKSDVSDSSSEESDADYDLVVANWF